MLFSWSKICVCAIFYAFSISGPDLGASAKSSLCKSFEEARLENTDHCVRFLAVLDALRVDAPPADEETGYM